MSGQLVLYVGQTRKTLARRASNHRAPTNTCGSKNIPRYIEWNIKLLEECEETHASDWERFYIEMYMPPYNQIIPGRFQEYKESDAYREHRKKYLKNYYLKQKARQECEQQKQVDQAVAQE